MKTPLQQVRLAWSPGITHTTDVIHFGDEWQPATPQNLEALKILLAVANELYGVGSHWLEWRSDRAQDGPQSPRQST